MPLNKDALIRYRIIDSCLRNKRNPYPSLEELIAACSEVLGKPVSRRTLQKDIEEMRHNHDLGYLAPIKYCHHNRGYFYEDETYTITSVRLKEGDIEALDFATTILEQFKDAGIIRQFTDAIDRILNEIEIKRISHEFRVDDKIQYEQTPPARGYEWLAPVLRAIQNRHPVRFYYRSGFSKTGRTRIVEPYLLKEYRNRWYLIGKDRDKTGQFRTFGLDRMSGLEIIEEDTFIKDYDFNPEQLFAHSFGITVPESPPEYIRLSFDPVAANYVRTQPLHHSQKILKDTPDELVIQLYVAVSYELISHILSYGPEVKVLEPESLKIRIKETIEKMLARYRS